MPIVAQAAEASFDGWLASWTITWSDIQQYGVTLCPGCAARLAPPWVNGEDGLRHQVCTARCEKCGSFKHLGNNGMECRSATCRVFQRWLAIWLQISVQYGVDEVARLKSKGKVVPGPDTNRLMPNPWADIAPILDNMSDKELVSIVMATTQKVRYRPDPQFWRWCRDLVWIVGRIADIHRTNGITWIVFGTVWRSIATDLARASRYMENFSGAFTGIVAQWKEDRSRERARLLNPNYDQIEDSAERRFAQLEIDDDE